jgi:hypothetical protein
MTRKLGQRSQEFLQEVYEPGYSPEAPRAKKPKGASQANGGARPAGKVSGEVDMEVHYRAGTVAKLTVDQLKGWLKVQGVNVGRKAKAELVGMVATQF